MPDIPPSENLPAVRHRSVRSAFLAGLGWVLVVIGPPIGLATPMIPIGFVIFGVGVGLVVRNSPKGRSTILTLSGWAEGRWPGLYARMPRKLRRLLSGEVA